MGKAFSSLHTQENSADRSLPLFNTSTDRQPNSTRAPKRVVDIVLRYLKTQNDKVDPDGDVRDLGGDCTVLLEIVNKVAPEFLLEYTIHWDTFNHDGKKKENLLVLSRALGKIYNVKLNKAMMAPDEEPFTDRWFEIVEKLNAGLIFRLAEAVMVAVFFIEGDTVPPMNERVSKIVDQARIVRERLATLDDIQLRGKHAAYFPCRRGEEPGSYLPPRPVRIQSTTNYKVIQAIYEDEVDRDKIIQHYRLPEEEVAFVDHSAQVPGMAFALGYQKRRVVVRQKARDQLETSFQQFAQGKSFWTIVPKIKDGMKECMFIDSEGQKIPFFSNEFDENSDRSFKGALNNEHHKSFNICRIHDNLVVVDIDDFHWNPSEIPGFDVPEGYDLLINPAFFAGSNFLNLSQDELQFINKFEKEGDRIMPRFYVSTLSEGIGKGFLLIFGKEWNNLVKTMERMCKDGKDANGVPWPLFLKEGMSTPAPAYYDIPRGYYTYASGLLLGMYCTKYNVREKIGVREVWAAGGVVGMYSFSRRSGQSEVLDVFAMLREAVYGCRSTYLGIKLLYSIPFEYHDDFLAFCSLPWSKTKPVLRGSVNLGESLEYFTRYVMTVTDPSSRCIMNFMGSVGLEFLGSPIPTMIEGHISVVADCYRDDKEAKDELRWFCDQQDVWLLPGAAIRAADPARDINGGILNVVQQRQITNGHVIWMKEFSFADSIVVQISIVVATLLGWFLNTGVFHFLLALTVLARIEEEVSIHGTLAVLLFGRRYGHKLYQDQIGQFLVPVALGAVEAVSEGELAENNNDLFVFRVVLLVGGGVAFGILFFTMIARLRYKDGDGFDYESVIERDGSIDCLLTGEIGTGFRDGDHKEAPGVGPLQAHVAADSNYDGTAIPSATNASAYHLSGDWVLAGTVNSNREFYLRVGTLARSPTPTTAVTTPLLNATKAAAKLLRITGNTSSDSDAADANDEGTVI